MANIDLFATVLKESLPVGQPLKYDVHLHLQENDAIIFYRGKGDLISAEDLKTLQANASATLLVKKSEIQTILQEAGRTLQEGLKGKAKLDSKEVLRSAATLLRTMDLGRPAPGSKISPNQSKVEILFSVQGVIQGILSEVASKPLVLCYDTVLKSIEGTALSDLDIHNLQVSALSVLMYLTEGKGSADKLANLALAGLMHDVGLNGVSTVLLDRHLEQHEVFNQFEQEEYNEHIQLSIDQVQKLYPKVPLSVLKAIEFHHENYDGTGPKRVSGNYIPHKARVIRIADDISISIVKSKYQLDFQSALGALTGPNLLKYDMQIVQSINDHYLKMGLGI